MSDHTEFLPGTDAFTDLYELTMMQSYYAESMEDEAVFDLFIRRLPESRNFLIVAGLEEALDYLESFQVSDETLRYLRSLNQFDNVFVDRLRTFRFTGDVYALDEGTVCFPHEPILQVRAPMPEAQFFETALLNIIQFQTMIASKAARIVAAAQGRSVVDFGARRIHSIEAALRAARACYIAGVAATSNVMAGRTYGIPVSGTMAHSYVEAFMSEERAFRAFASEWPGTTILVDTYDTLEGVRTVVRLAHEQGEDFRISAVRLDSGDLAELASEARTILDAGGLNHVQIFASSSLDEYEIDGLLKQGAPIDGFGVGTRMGVSADAPSLDGVYKLAVYAEKGRMKLSPEKATLPGLKQVFRQLENGIMKQDLIALAGEDMPGNGLLRKVMENGRRTRERQTLASIRETAKDNLSRLPGPLKSLSPAEPPYEVQLSEGIRREAERVKKRLHEHIRTIEEL